MSLTPDEQALLDCLPDDGGTRGNLAARRQLGWEPDRYWAVRDSLVDAGLVVRGRGQGGSVRKVLESKKPSSTVSVAVDVVDPIPDVQNAVQSEIALYEPMRYVIKGEWAKDHRNDFLAVEVRLCRVGGRLVGSGHALTLRVWRFEPLPTCLAST